MRLLYRSDDGKLELTKDLTRDELSEYPYAILSHTWLLDNLDEVSFQDLTCGRAETKPKGFAKIQFCGEQAARNGLKYFWVDTCCINKESAPELQEAITSMFSWYRDSVRCYVYLWDVSVGGLNSSANLWQEAFRHSRWFTRGWTLQELLAPKCVEFFSEEGTRLGDKMSLLESIHDITKIPSGALSGDDLGSFGIEERFSWAENRQTRRREDKAYCLLGIFNISMTLIYGEEDGAFDRLREKLHRKHTDGEHFLSKLPAAEDAAFNCFRNQHAPTCLPETRVELLDHITTWVDNLDDERCIFWLSGIAGTGKSTVARTIARHYSDHRKLGGSFFFIKKDSELGQAKMFVTTLARQLASRVPLARLHICEAIMSQDDIQGLSLRDQWEQLIIGPLSKIKHSPPLTVLFVVDALDECGDENNVRAILKAVSTAESLTAVRLRILITSRPETPIRLGFRGISESKQKHFILHEVSYALVNRDLRLLFEKEFATIREERGFEDHWPGVRCIERLVERSGRLFIWTATACRFIAKGNKRNIIQRRLDRLVNRISSDAGPEQQLDKIYTTVLQEFSEQYPDDEDREDLFELLKDVLGTIVILCAPMTVQSLAVLIDRPFDDVNEALADLQTIFSISSEEPRTVNLHHPTFRDFLINDKRCTDDEFRVDEKQAHGELGRRCRELMERNLRFNICGLSTPGALVSSIQASSVESCIPRELQYACLHWVDHYRQSGTQFSDGDEVSVFFREHFLHWLEAINIAGKSGEMGAIIRLYHSLLMPDTNSRQIPFVKDARRFMYNFQNIMKEAPLQTYCSPLTFIPRTNELKYHFRRQRHFHIEKSALAEADVPKPKDDFNYVSDLVFTTDSLRIASGSNFEAVRFWDVETRAKIRKFEGGAVDKMSAIAISPDGKTLAGGSDDFTVMAWDIETGILRYSIKAHRGWVNSVAFSGDGKLLASGSMDETVAIWDTATGQLRKRINNQSSSVNSATFSPDGSLIATGSVDDIVRLWDNSKSSDSLRMTLDGHSGPINSVRFSRSGRQLVSGSDDLTIRLWDISTGDACLPPLKGHTKKVMAVTFSPDDRIIASGSEDKTVRLWDVSSGALLKTLRDHTSGINAVVFSPNSKLLATSSFDDEVQLWNTKSCGRIGKLEDFPEDINSGTLATQRPYIPSSAASVSGGRSHKGHSKMVTRVVFSPDSQWLASGSQDGSIKLFLGQSVQWKLEGHTGAISHLLFSPDSDLLVSSSTDKNVIVWDPAEGELSHTLDSHTGAILDVTFSPIGHLLATSSADHTVGVWDPWTGLEQAKLTGHTSAVTGVAFSPDSRHVVSWSEDSTARLWDLATHETLEVLMGHSSAVNSVAFSSDGALLASCGEDARIFIWKHDGTLVSSFECGPRPATVIAWTPNSQHLATCSTDSKAQLWDMSTGMSMASIDAGVVIRKMAFSECGQFIITDRGTLGVASFESDRPNFFAPKSSSAHSMGLRLFATRDWLKRDMQNVLWLPDEYQATDVATLGNEVVLGHSSGAISFITVR